MSQLLGHLPFGTRDLHVTEFKNPKFKTPFVRRTPNNTTDTMLRAEVARALFWKVKVQQLGLHARELRLREETPHRII